MTHVSEIDGDAGKMRRTAMRERQETPWQHDQADDTTGDRARYDDAERREQGG